MMKAGYVVLVVLGLAVSAAAFVPQSRAYVAEVLNSFCGQTTEPVPPAVLRLNEAEETLRKDLDLLRGQQVGLRAAIRGAEEKREAAFSLRSATEGNALRYRDALVKARANGDGDVVVDRMVFSQDELSDQIDVLLGGHELIQRQIEFLSELLSDAVGREKEVVAALVSVGHALDRIPLQRAIVLSQGLTEQTSGVIAEIEGLHRKVESIQRAPKLLTPEEVEAKHKEATPVKGRNSDRLDTFLDGGDVFESRR